MAEVLDHTIIPPLKDLLNQLLAGGKQVMNVKNELQNLLNHLGKIQEHLRVEVVEREQRGLWKEYLWELLEEVESITYEVEDEFGEYRKVKMKINVKPKALDHHKVHVRKARRLAWTVLEKVLSSILPPCSCLIPVSVLQVIEMKIKKINGTLELIWKEGSERSNYLVTTSKTLAPRPWSSWMNVKESKVYGRKLDMSSLLDHILSEINTTSRSTSEEVILKEDGIKVISIVGSVGSGKTTLAQLLYNDSNVQKQFEVTEWVCVSDAFDEIRVAKCLLRPFDHLRDVVFDQNTKLEVLLQYVNENFSGKTFLVVFDDVWTEDYSKWKPFKDSLGNGAPGSIILVTTRSERVARTVRTDQQHIPSPLSKLNCWSILKHTAWCGRPRPRPRLPREMKKIGLKIAEKCKGSPLVAKIVGELLRVKDTAKEWQRVLEKEIWEMDEVVMELSNRSCVNYNELSPQLKQCFLYCSVFPKNAVIDVDQLIRMWMVQGYLGHPSEGHKIMKRKGIECFNDLADRCFFQELVKGSIHKNKITSFKMQDAYHDLLQYMARSDFAGLDESETSQVFIKYMACRDLGGLSLKNTLLYEAPDYTKMRSFVQISDSQLPPRLFERLKYVRTLVLSSCQLEELPSEVGNLTRLRYLDLSGNPLYQLPERICDLCNLEFLDVHSCYVLSCLPQRIGDLEQLKHLRINHTTDEIYDFPQGFERLTSIQTLDVFRAGGRYKDTIKKLRDLNHLEEIRIAVHGEVNFPDAILESKTEMENLELCFIGDGRDQERASSSSIEELLPPPNLQMLKFENYPGLRLPKWIVAESVIKNLRRLSLSSALNIQCSQLPLWNLSCLEFLWLYDIPNLEHLGCEFFGLSKTLGGDDDDDDDDDGDDDCDGDEEEDEEIADQAQGHPGAKRPASFPKLKTLRIEHLENWTTWEELDEKDEKESDISVMPGLEELIISNCPKLEALPRCISEKISSLKVLELSSKLQRYSDKRAINR